MLQETEMLNNRKIKSHGLRHNKPLFVQKNGNSFFQKERIEKFTNIHFIINAYFHHRNTRKV
jgi:hypothetical protein